MSKLPKSIKIYKNDQEFEANLPETVKLLKTKEGSKVFLVGCSHFSKESQDDVSLVIRNVKPDVVMLELCHLRVDILNINETNHEQELSTEKVTAILKKHGPITGGFYLYLLRMSTSITKQLGVAPGGECRRAIAEVEEFVPNCKILLGDRPINITVQRAIRGLSLSEKILFSLYMLVPRKNGTPITHEFVEQYKTEEYLKKGDDEKTKTEFPSITKSFVTERDMFLAHTLQKSADFQKTSGGILRPVKVVGIIGIGHIKGIMKYWEKVDHLQIKEFLKIPPQKMSVQIATFCVKYGLAALVGYGSYSLFNSKEKK